MKGNKKMKCEVIKIEIDPIRILKHEILNKDNFNVSKWTREDLKVLTEVVKTLEESLNSELHFHFDISKWSRKDLEILRRVIKTLEEAFYPRLYFHTHPEMEGRCNLSKDHVIIDKEVYDVIFNNLNERK
jgi:hypothetical protein